MLISLIAAVGENLEIGKNGGLIRHLPGDLPFFKRVTMGKPVIMGRKTFESLPRALPGRLNIIITSDSGYAAENATVVTSPAAALDEAKKTETDEVFIIGGESVYSQFLPTADRLYLTEARFSAPDADKFFPPFDKSEWVRQTLDIYDGDPPYEHALYTKKRESAADFNTAASVHTSDKTNF